MLGQIVRAIDFYLLCLPNIFCSFRILITGGSSGLVETITDAVSIHSIKKAEYAKKLAEGKLGHVTLLDHFISVGRIPSLPDFYLSPCRHTATHHLQNSPELRRILPNLSQVRTFAVLIRIL